MQKTILLNNQIVSYNLQYKNVKNINLRIKPDGTVNVSANRFVTIGYIEEFIISKSSFILNALNKYEKNKEETELIQYFSEDEIRNVITSLCNKAYPYYEKLGIGYPKIRFRTMISRWGSCHPIKKILTFNLNLRYAPVECIEYVVYHEFTHFLQANHSKKFYEELSKVCPKWKECRKKLKEISIK